MLTRIGHSRDFSTGIELSNTMLGKNSSLEVHHIFPKHLLYEQGLSKSEVNQIANYAFLTKDTNLEISDRNPAEYLSEFVKKTPGAIESHWIPNDPYYWDLNNYEEFLTKRREKLAEGANEFLNSLYDGTISAVEIENYSARDLEGITITQENDEEAILNGINNWIDELGLNIGIKDYEIVNDSGDVLARIDLAWPNGIQEGLSQPVAVLIDEPEDVRTTVNQQGFIFFTDADSFKNHVLSKV